MSTINRNAFARCPCGHLWMHHDINEYDGDGSDLCCVEGCDQAACPGPSTAGGRVIIHTPESLINDLRRYMAWEVPAEIAAHALRAARGTYPEADDRWIVERAAYLIRRKM